MTSTTPFDPASATIAIVTYNRSGLLTRLLESITRMDPKPGHVVIIDNASVDDTTELVESFRDRLGTELVYKRLETNTGGSGGFSEGMRVAYELGSTWMWLMDDDVEVLPDGLGRMGAWAPRFKSIQGRRYDYDGSEFYWQYRVAEPLGIPIPFAPAGFDESGFKEMNSGCFEGMFIHRDIVAEIGLPDPRFFIYWDDQMYGWLASRKTTSVIVNEFVLRRTREIKQWDMGIRHMNASSNAYRYYIMRNRGHMKNYYRSLGVYNPVLFGAGTALTFGKELIRLLAVEHTVRGTIEPLPRRARRSQDRARCLVEADAAAGGRGRRRSARVVVRVVSIEHFGDRSIHGEPAFVEVQTARAEAAQVLLVVADEEEGPPVCEELVDARVALLAERLVADSEHFIHEQDRLLQSARRPRTRGGPSCRWTGACRACRSSRATQRSR